MKILIKQTLNLFLQLYYKFKFRSINVRFLNNSKITKSCFFEGYNSVGERTKLSNCYLGQGSYVGRNNELSSVKIGKFSSIGSFIINTTGRHPSSLFVSTHPAFFSEGQPAGFTFTSKRKFQELFYVKKLFD